MPLSALMPPCARSGIQMSSSTSLATYGAPSWEVAVTAALEGVRSWMLDLYSGWEKVDLSCEELIDAGEQVIAVLSVRGRGRVSGIELEYRPAGVWTLRQGKVVRVVWFPARDEALEAVGRGE
jgi:ketosteroid isomerase-like protein